MFIQGDFSELPSGGGNNSKYWYEEYEKDNGAEDFINDTIDKICSYENLSA